MGPVLPACPLVPGCKVVCVLTLPNPSQNGRRGGRRSRCQPSRLIGMAQPRRSHPSGGEWSPGQRSGLRPLCCLPRGGREEPCGGWTNGKRSLKVVLTWRHIRKCRGVTPWQPPQRLYSWVRGLGSTSVEYSDLKKCHSPRFTEERL